MEFEDIKEEVEEIYSNKKFPTLDVVFSQDIRIIHTPKVVLGDVELSLGTEKLIEEKGMGNEVESLIPVYWDFAVNIYNNFSGEINGVKNLLEERRRELEKAYYHKTQVIKNLFVNQKEGNIFYNKHKDAYLSMVTNLCYMQIYLFEKELNEYPKLRKAINDMSIKMGKTIVIKHLDITQKLDGINNVLHFTLFNFKDNMIRKVKKWAKLKQTEREKISKSNSDKLYLAKSWLPDLIKDIAEMEEPTHEKILGRIKRNFPNFEKVPQEVDLKFTKGLDNINKTSIDKALTYLFNKMYKEDIQVGSIKKRFDSRGYW